jgi:hypothetical protein
VVTVATAEPGRWVVSRSAFPQVMGAEGQNPAIDLLTVSNDLGDLKVVWIPHILVYVPEARQAVLAIFALAEPAESVPVGGKP